MRIMVVEIFSAGLEDLIDLFRTITFLFLALFFTALFFYLQWKIIQIYTWMVQRLYPIVLYLYERFVAIKGVDSKKAHKSKI